MSSFFSRQKHCGRLCALAILLLLCAWRGFAQEVEQIKQGVVRIESLIKGAKRTGTGFVVKLEPDTVHIVTATHVVQFADKIEVSFFSKPDSAMPAKARKMEDDEWRGIAHLVVNAAAPAGTRALAIAAQGQLSEASDEVLTIGFPSGAPDWSPKRLTFATRDGRELLFDGKVNQGNSGGPLLKDGQVVGLVQREKDGYVRASPASAIVEFLEGSNVALRSSTVVGKSLTSRDVQIVFLRSGAADLPVRQGFEQIKIEGGPNQICEIAVSRPELKLVVLHQSSAKYIQESAQSSLPTMQWAEELTTCAVRDQLDNIYVQLGQNFQQLCEVVDPRDCVGALGQLINGLGVKKVVVSEDFFSQRREWAKTFWERVEIPPDMLSKHKWEVLLQPTKKRLLHENERELFSRSLNNRLFDLR